MVKSTGSSKAAAKTVGGHFNSDGGWAADEGSPWRSLTVQEVADLQAMAETTTPIFGGEHNAAWEEHHPIARAAWEKRGVKPQGK